MAAEGGVSGRLTGLDRSCVVCHRTLTDIPTVKYCFQCEVCFCENCAGSHVNMFTRHRMTNIESDDVKLVLTSQTEPCQQHGKQTDFFCKVHDLIGCKLCMDDHRSCSGLVCITLSTKELLNDCEIKKVEPKLKEAIDRIESIKMDQQGVMTILEADKEQCLQEINVRQEELIGLIENIIQTSKDRVHVTFDRLSADLQHHHQEVEKQLAELEETEKRLNNDDDNEVKLFIEIKKCQQQLRSAEEVSAKSLENLKVRGFTVAVDKRLQTLLDELESLVTILERAPARVSRRYLVDISTNEDKEVCDVYGGCILSDRGILMADMVNNVLQLIEQHSHKVIDKYCLQSEPEDVCLTKPNEVAVALDNNTVMFFAVKPCLTHIRTITMNHRCVFISYAQNKLFITDSIKSVYIYNMTGDLLKKISTTPSAEELFTSTRHITVDETTCYMYVADRDKGVMTFDREGNLLVTLLTGTIQGSYGVCLDGAGGIFVCGFNSHNVVHLGPDGMITAEILTKSDGLKKPTSVCYDMINKRLFVTQSNSNYLHV